jgi:hypothetical protein
MALPAEDIRDHGAAAILEQVHNQAIRAPIKEAAESLQRLLSGRLAAYVVGVKDVKTITRWTTGEVTDIRVESEQRLRTA